MNVRRAVGVNLLSNIALAVLGVLSGAIVARWFGPDGRGTLSAAQVSIAVAASFGALGLGDAVLYRTATTGLMRSSIVTRLTMLATVVGGALGAALGLLVGGWLEVAGTVGFAALVCLGAATGGALNVQQGVTRGVGLFGTWNVARISAAIAWIVAIAVAREGSTLRLGVFAVLFGSVVMLIAIVLGLLNRRRSKHAPVRPVAFRSLLAYGLPSAFSTIPTVLNARIDQFALAFVATTSSLGYYAAAAGYCWAVVPLAQAISIIVPTRVASRADTTERVSVLRRFLGIGATLVIISAAVAWLLAPWALPLLNSDQFGPAVPIARVLLLGAACQGMTVMLEEGARGLGVPRLAMRAELAGLTVMVLLLVVAVQHGGVATAWASTAGYVTSFVVALHGVSRLSGVPWWRLARPSMRGAIAALRGTGGP